MDVVPKLTQIGMPIKVQQRRSNMEAVFRCTCGKCVIVSINSVKSGKTKSCGCYRKNVTSLQKRKHGKSGSKIYHVWHDMMRRCYDKTLKTYPDYGGRGITVATEWHDFMTFFLAVGDVPFNKAQIDRIDNSRGYEPGNVRFVTSSQNLRNTRRTRWVQLNGEIVPMVEAAEKLGMSRHKLRHALNRGSDVSGVSWSSNPSQGKRKATSVVIRFEE